MARSAEALIKPELLEWARRSARLELDAAAKKVQVRPERLAAWEDGQQRPTIKQLRKLAAAYKRPIAVFYLPEAPTDFQPLRDFRRLPGVPSAESPELAFEIRHAQARRDIAEELYEATAGMVPALPLAAEISEPAGVVATRIRQFLGVEYEDQMTWAPGYPAFNQWRDAIEEAGILVFQASTIETSEARGFAVYASRLPAVVINIKDALAGRIFTLLHELTHLALHEGSICDLRERAVVAEPDSVIEVFCNRVAGEALIPSEHLLQEPTVTSRQGPTEWTDGEINSLAARYGASSEVVLRRLLSLGRTSQAFYEEKRQAYLDQYESRRRRDGFAPPHRMAISTNGHLFTRLVLDTFNSEYITARDLSDFLGVRLKHLSKIEYEIADHASPVGAD